MHLRVTSKVKKKTHLKNIVYYVKNVQGLYQQLGGCNIVTVWSEAFFFLLLSLGDQFNTAIYLKFPSSLPQ